MNTFGERIYALREMKNLTQRDLAKLLDISPSTLSRYEKNDIEPSSVILNKLSTFFETSPHYLLNGNKNLISISDKDFTPLEVEYIQNLRENEALYNLVSYFKDYKEEEILSYLKLVEFIRKINK